jgi:lipopolysaccharide biosynthesis glycosyltransferase
VKPQKNNKRGFFKVIRRLFRALRIKRYEIKFNGKPLDAVLDDIREVIRKRRDIYLRDEDVARKLADDWNGTVQKPQNLRFIENAIPVVLCVNENFAPYLAVMLQSLLENSNPRRKYHFMVFGRELSNKTQNYLANQTEQFSHCTIDFVDMSSMLDGIPLLAVNHVSVDAYSRLFIPYWLDKYKKVIYLDSDMIAKADIAELYDLDIAPFPMGISVGGEAARCIEERRYGYFMKRSSVFMLLENWSRYINSGVLVFDTEKFIKKFPYREFFRFAIYFTNRYAKRLNDQDVLALLVKDDYYVLPNDWNYSWSMRAQKGKYLPAKPGTKIVHFTGGLKPWKKSPLINDNIDAIEYRKFALNVPLFRDTASLA